MDIVITRLELDRRNAADALEAVDQKLASLDNALAAAIDLHDQTSKELEALDAALTLLKNEQLRQAMRA